MTDKSDNDSFWPPIRSARPGRHRNGPNGQRRAHAFRNWTFYTRVRFDERTLRTLAAAAMDVGDPLTEAVCWTAAWQLVIAAELAAADFADLVIRRLAGPALTGPPSAGPPIPGLPLVGVETLLERAVECAGVYAPRPTGPQYGNGSLALSLS